MTICGGVEKPEPALDIEMEPNPAPVKEAVRVGVFTEELKTPGVKGFIGNSLLLKVGSKDTVVVVTLVTCPA